jgi:hypothetical protein
MEKKITANELIERFARRTRVLVLGGIAVISHGMSRNTCDVDVWVDPGEDAEAWARLVLAIIVEFPQVFPARLALWTPIAPSDLSEAIENDGMVRLMGLDRPLDLFRRPNKLDMDEFNEVWGRGKPLGDGTRLPDMIDVLVTKQSTGRQKEITDILFLESRIEAEYLDELPDASEKRAEEMLGRFLTPNVARAALAHPSFAIRQLGYAYLQELARDGDPYAAEYLREEPAPYETPRQTAGNETVRATA